MTRKTFIALMLVALLPLSCIDPPLHLPGEQVLTEVPMVQTQLNVVWSIDANWTANWYYGWDAVDNMTWGPIGYSEPTSFQVRRYFTGDDPKAPHTSVDAFSIQGKSFRRFFSFGYYDILFWSDIDSPDGTQVLVINETPEVVTAGTTGTRGVSRGITQLISKGEEGDDVPGSIIGLKNQPEIFYASYPEDVFISRDMSDYIYDPVENIYIKQIESELTPLVYIYLVQIILTNNDGRVKGINGNAAITSMASGTNVNTGHTNDEPSVVYFNTLLKRNKDVEGVNCDIIGGKLTTFGLCDMEPYTRSGRYYEGSRSALKNHLLFDLVFSNDVEKTYSAEVTTQCQTQAHGGVITVYIDCSTLTPPETPEQGTGSLFVPTVEDYDEVIWEIEM